MDFITANRVAQDIEDRYSDLIVAGLRRTNLERPHDSWALDVVNRQTGRMVTVDEKDAWETVIDGAFPRSARRS